VLTSLIYDADYRLFRRAAFGLVTVVSAYLLFSRNATIPFLSAAEPRDNTILETPWMEEKAEVEIIPLLQDRPYRIDLYRKLTTEDLWFWERWWYGPVKEEKELGVELFATERSKEAPEKGQREPLFRGWAESLTINPKSTPKAFATCFARSRLDYFWRIRVTQVFDYPASDIPPVRTRRLGDIQVSD
jgi:hypothetical protein